MTEESTELLQAISIMMDKRFGIFEERMDKMDAKLDNLEKRMDKMDAKLDNLELRMDKMELRMDQMEQRMDKMDAKFDSLKEELLSEIHHSENLILDEVARVHNILMIHQNDITKHVS